jgi:hypothetical protein
VNRAPFSRGGRPGETEEDEDGSIEAHHVLVVELAEEVADLRLRDGRDLVHHKTGSRLESVQFRRLHEEPKERRLGRIGGEGANGDGGRGIEPVILQDDRRPRLSGIAAGGNGPDLTALHSSPDAEIASMKAWSSLAQRLRATARDWRCASA